VISAKIVAVLRGVERWLAVTAVFESVAVATGRRVIGELGAGGACPPRLVRGRSARLAAAVAVTAAVVLVVRDLGAVADAGLWTEGLPFHPNGAFRGT
jgi:hypothetical protein